jgi:surface protein
MNKYKLYMILGIIVLVLSVSSSFAYYVWKSSTNALVSLNVCTPTITFAGGSTINGTDMIPVLTKEEGTIKDIEVKKNSTCNRDVTMNLYLELTTFPTELAESSFVYELYKNSETMAIASGNFSNKEQGNTITLLSNQILNTSKDTYTLYIYIDGNVDNPGTMAGKNFLFKLWGSGEGAIYKENVITTTDNPTGGTSKFFNTEVMREEIQSLTIAEDNTVPDTPGVVSKDISQNKDGTVMLWYTPKEVTSSDGSTKTMYDMWIGGENGVLQTGTNASGMFAYLTNIEKLDLSKLDTSYITNMSRMFYNSSGLKSIDLSNFNTSNVTDMVSMFEGCSNLITLDLSSFDTSKVTNMNSMFYGCSNLESLDLSNFNTSKVTSMQQIFCNCISLTNIVLFNTSNVTKMFGMFQGCSSLINLDLSSFDTSKVTDMRYMFYNCSSLTELNLSSFNTSKVTSMQYMFGACSSLTKMDVSNFDTSNVTVMGGMFYGCSNLTILDLSSFNTSNVISTEQMFRGCVSLTILNISNFDTRNVTNMFYMFRDCKTLKSLDLTSFNTSKVTNMASMFGYCSSLKTIYISNIWSITSVTNGDSMFYDCTSLVGAVPFDKTKTDISMANYTTGYLTYKSNN